LPIDAIGVESPIQTGSKMLKTTYVYDLFKVIQTYKSDVEEGFKSIFIKGIFFAFLFCVPIWFLMIITVIWLSGYYIK
jgi:formate/nitrite transporter FocA (FNT family)